MNQSQEKDINIALFVATIIKIILKYGMELN
jgi:hypothetical protein